MIIFIIVPAFFFFKRFIKMMFQTDVIKNMWNLLQKVSGVVGWWGGGGWGGVVEGFEGGMRQRQSSCQEADIIAPALVILGSMLNLRVTSNARIQLTG